MFSHGRIRDTMSVWVSLVVLTTAVGCIGTDLVEELALFDPRIEVHQDSAALLIGQTQALAATYYDGFGQADLGRSIEWQTSDPSVASVDAAGTVTALASGQTEVYALASDAQSPAVLITVVATENDAAVVVVIPDSVVVTIGTQQSLDFEARNIRGEVVTGSATWTSSAPNVATVDPDGTANALAPGTALITATVDGISSVPAQFIVLGRRLTGTFSPRPNTSYNVSGTAVLREVADRGLFLDLGSDFLASEGPNVQVYLSQTDAVTSGSVSLGVMRSPTGAQTYPVPSSIQFGEYTWVVIHCVAFNVTFGSAKLR